MKNHCLTLGVELSHSFSGYPVKLFKSEGSYYVKCKHVFFSYDTYLSFLENPSKNVLGYNLEGKPCKIRNINGLITIGCLKDTEEKFKLIVNQVNKLIRNDKKK